MLTKCKTAIVAKRVYIVCTERCTPQMDEVSSFDQACPLLQLVRSYPPQLLRILRPIVPYYLKFDQRSTANAQAACNIVQTAIVRFSFSRIFTIVFHFPTLTKITQWNLPHLSREFVASINFTFVSLVIVLLRLYLYVGCNQKKKTKTIWNEKPD